MASTRVTLYLLAAGLLLPIAMVVLGSLAALLGGLGDRGGAHFLQRATLGLLALWLIDLVMLLLAAASRTLPRRLSDDAEPLEGADPGQQGS
jgi:preprotein translocase subunit SecG